jgi:hypothetical protein
MYVTLDDGRVVTASLTTRLRAASPAARRRCEVVDEGTALHWPLADEDIGVNYVLGMPEQEYDRIAYGLKR